MRPPRPRPSGFFSVTGRLRDAFVALCLFTSAFCLLPSAFADIQAPPRATAPGERRLQRRVDGPPSAIPQETAVEQGGRTEIILRAEGQVGRMIYFLIRNPPKHGTLAGPPTQISRSAASIGYVHDPGDDAPDDEFTFCTQAVGSAVSAPETVRIRVLPAPPIIEVSPPELDFGAVKAGETARATLTLENRGGSEARGRVDPPAPWVVDGSPDYRLPRGASQNFQLVFRPQDERVFTDELHVQYETSNGVRLVGTGLMDPAQRAAALAARANNGRAGDAAANDAGAGSGRDVIIVGGNAPTARVAATPRPAAASVLAGSGSSVRPANPGVQPPRVAIHDGSLDQAGGAHGRSGLNVASISLNEASVDKVEVRSVKDNTVDLAWKPPAPAPASYRVEVRYLSMDDDEKLRIDWRPYAKTDFQMTGDSVQAHLRGLPQEGFQMLRVVAVDRAGRTSAPSPMITVLMPWPTAFWHVTPLKVLIALLVICIVLVIRRRLENEAILREIDDDRAEARRASEAEASVVWKA